MLTEGNYLPEFQHGEVEIGRITIKMMNAEGDLGEGLDFFWAESSFYPDFDMFLRQRVIEAYAKAYNQGRAER